MVVPQEIAEETLEKALAREEHEDESLKRYLAGEITIWDNYGFGKVYEKLGLTEEE